jgi:hypothetical protein
MLTWFIVVQFKLHANIMPTGKPIKALQKSKNPQYNIAMMKCYIGDWQGLYF